ncbi:MAG: hypothetical protein ACUVTY_12655, partial [Armatimonadota bacterium]
GCRRAIPPALLPITEELSPRNSNGFEHTDDQPNAVLRRKVLGWLVGIINLTVIGGIITPVLGVISRQQTGEGTEESGYPS